MFNCRLVAGHHRVLAAKSLGWEVIPCFFVELDGEHRDLWELDENLIRAELTPAEVAQHLARRKVIWKAMGGRTSLTLGGEQQIGFARDTAETTGMSKRTVNEAVARGERIVPDVIQGVVGTALDTGTSLDRLAKLTPDEQRRAVEAGELPPETPAPTDTAPDEGRQAGAEPTPAAHEIDDRQEHRPTAAASRAIGSDAGLAARAEICAKFLNESVAGSATPLEGLRVAWKNARPEDRQTFLAEIGVDESDDDEPEDDGEPATDVYECVVQHGDIVGGG
jgi:ParB-like chromosome segregation protein Spo0J